MTSLEKNNEFKEAIAALQSTKEEEVLVALSYFRKRGNSATVEAIVQLLLKPQSPAIENEVTNYLFDLQDDTAIQPLIDAIEDYRFKAHKAVLIAAFWQAAIDGSDHLSFFIEQLQEASYEEILEIITVIENLNGPFIETEIMECIDRLNEIVYEEGDEEKRTLLLSLNEVLNQL
jgi:HEAT repeat protein